MSTSLAILVCAFMQAAGRETDICRRIEMTRMCKKSLNIWSSWATWACRPRSDSRTCTIYSRYSSMVKSMTSLSSQLIDAIVHWCFHYILRIFIHSKLYKRGNEPRDLATASNSFHHKRLHVFGHIAWADHHKTRHSMSKGNPLSLLSRSHCFLLYA